MEYICRKTNEMNTNTIQLKGKVSFEKYQMAIRVLEAMDFEISKSTEDHKTNQIINDMLLKSKEQISKGEIMNIRELLKVNE